MSGWDAGRVFCVSTGRLPSPERTRAALSAVHGELRGLRAGRVADYIPALGRASPDWFGLRVAGVSGFEAGIGDDEVAFTIQSVSKPFVFALVCREIGEEAARARLGVNSTGSPFNCAIAVERSSDGTTNPMVNAGAIAATSLLPGATAEAKWEFVRRELSRFAGRELEMDREVYESESATNAGNVGLAEALRARGAIAFDPLEAVDVYTRQCSLSTTARDLAMMGATLANGGVNPATGEAVTDPGVCRRTLAVMVTAGLYENSGDWLYDTGLPGKSGVSGGMVAVAPGKGALGVFCPLLDESGNSVKGQLAARRLSEELGLNLFASEPWRRDGV